MATLPTEAAGVLILFYIILLRRYLATYFLVDTKASMYLPYLSYSQNKGV